MIKSLKNKSMQQELVKMEWKNNNSIALAHHHIRFKT